MKHTISETIYLPFNLLTTNIQSNILKYLKNTKLTKCTNEHGYITHIYKLNRYQCNKCQLKDMEYMR